MTDFCASRDFAAERDAVDAALAQACRAIPSGVAPQVAEAICYALSGGGKRVRALLFLGAYRAAGGVGSPACVAAALEIVHAYSLVHDDLPCMDDDDVRRGRPATHVAFGVPVALAAGAAMLPLAVIAVARGAERGEISPDTASPIVSAIMRAAGAQGMIGGQLLDLAAEARALDLAELGVVHGAKTGALLAGAAQAGGLAAAADADTLCALAAFGSSLGLAFQIVDDVLDVTGTREELGKTVGRDAVLAKSSYSGLLGVQSAVDRARATAQAAQSELALARLLTPYLRAIAELVINRTS